MELCHHMTHWGGRGYRGGFAKVSSDIYFKNLSYHFVLWSFLSNRLECKY